VGEKTWWVAETDLGKGPFRWVVYQGEGGMLLVTSEPFDLPGSKDATVKINVSLAPWAQGQIAQVPGTRPGISKDRAPDDLTRVSTEGSVDRPSNPDSR
jgi:hypothetical protein